MFGEEALVLNLATCATAIAEGPVSCVGMDRATFTEVSAGRASGRAAREIDGEIERGERRGRMPVYRGGLVVGITLDRFGD